MNWFSNYKVNFKVLMPAPRFHVSNIRFKVQVLSLGFLVLRF